MEDRTSLGKRISEGLLPQPLVNILNKEIITGTVFNGWSIVHMISGMIAGLFIDEWLTALIVHTLWEIFQFIVGDNTFTTEDILFDIPLDTIMFMLGWWIVKNQL